MYRVVWGRAITDKISLIYDRMSATGKERILSAVALIDEALSQEPMSVGESRERNDVRVVVEPPVSVTFIVDVRQQLVIVAGIQVFIRPS